MTSFSVEGKTVTVVGAARSGIAAALLLADRGARVTLTDTRPAIDDEAADTQLRRSLVTLELGEHRSETFNRADLIVLSPGVPLDQPHVASARRSGVPVIGEIELASRWLIPDTDSFSITMCTRRPSFKPISARRMYSRSL